MAFQTNDAIKNGASPISMYVISIAIDWLIFLF